MLKGLMLFSWFPHFRVQIPACELVFTRSTARMEIPDGCSNLLRF
jgi:hypothetical protein